MSNVCICGGVGTCSVCREWLYSDRIVVTAGPAEDFCDKIYNNGTALTADQLRNIREQAHAEGARAERERIRAAVKRMWSERASKGQIGLAALSEVLDFLDAGRPKPDPRVLVYDSPDERGRE